MARKALEIRSFIAAAMAEPRENRHFRDFESLTCYQCGELSRWRTAFKRLTTDQK